MRAEPEEFEVAGCRTLGMVAEFEHNPAGSGEAVKGFAKDHAVAMYRVHQWGETGEAVG